MLPHMKLLAFFTLFTLSTWSYSQKVETIQLSELQTLISKKSDHPRIINFWASWCGPCIKELPYFQELSGTKGTEIILVSLDFPRDLEKAQQILSKKQITLKAYLLDEKDVDKYIRSINEDWSGAIPATLAISAKGNRQFFEKSFEKEELKNLINKLSTQ